MKRGTAGAGKPKKKRSIDEELERLHLQVERLAKQPHPVIAGPFTGEVGFELLYWIPLVRWVLKEFPELNGRLTVVSRGGTADWLSGLDCEYVDILTLFEPADFARHRALSDKQREVAPFEEQVIEALRRQPAFADAEVLHPSLLYQSYFRVLKLNQLAYPLAAKARIDEPVVDGLAAVYARIEVPPLRDDVAAALPDDFVAVRFYTSLSFYDSPETRSFASTIIESISRQSPVVLLGGQFGLDEHEEAVGALPEGVVTIDHLMRPEDNLAIQTQVVGRAKAFVGTYGGYSYLAPFLGVPSLSFSMDRAKTHSWHYTLAEKIFEGPGFAPFVALRHTDLPLVDLVTRDHEPAVLAAPSPGASS